METAALLGSATSTPTTSPQRVHGHYSATSDSERYIDGDEDDELDFTESQHLLPKSGTRKDSTVEIFKLANQSIDEMLNEIQAKSPGINLYSSGVTTSPLTEPLFAKKDIQTTNNSDTDNEMSEYEEGETTEEAIKSIAFDNSLLRSDSMTFMRKKSDSSVPPLSFTGPRTFSDESPSKKAQKKTSGSPKRVTIEMSPPKVINYEQEEYLYNDDDASYEGEAEDIEEVSQSDFIWEAVPVKINDPKLYGRPLPPIQHSTSDYSINSLPNLPSSKNNLLDSPIRPKQRANSHSDYENDDSEETVVMSPLSHAKNSTEDYSKAAQDFMKLNQKIPTDKNLKALLETSPSKGKLEYDHNMYLEDSKRGELIESKDIVKNRSKRENFINELSVANPLDNDTTEQDLIIADLGDLYDQNIRNTKQDGSLFLNRNDSVKSQMSIASVDRKLKTTVIKKRMDNIELKDGIKGFSDKIVEELIDRKHRVNEVDEQDAVDSGNEQDIEDSNNDDSMEELNALKNTDAINMGHSRQSSLSDTMGRFFNSMGDSLKRSFSGNELTADAETVALPKPSKNAYKSNSTARGNRNFSAQSATTSVTNESDFVSAEEDFENDSENESTTHQHDFRSAIYHHDSIDGIESQADETFHGEDEDLDVAALAQDEASSVNTLEHPSEASVKVAPTKEIADISVESAAADKSVESNYFLEAPKFDDDPYEFSRDFDELGLDSSNPSSRKTSSGSHSTGGKRISSSESSPLSEVSAIWQNQPTFQNLHKTAPSFQSICDPTSKKQFVFVDSHPKSISVSKHQSSISTFSTRTISMSSTSSSVKSPIVSRLPALPSSDEIQITNPLADESTDISGLANSTSIVEDDSVVVQDKHYHQQSEPLPEIEENSAAERPQSVSESPMEQAVAIEEPAHESTVQQIDGDESLSNLLEGSHNLSDIVKGADDSDFLKWDIDDSDHTKEKLLQDSSINKVEDAHQNETKETEDKYVQEMLKSPILASNDTDVCDIWRTGTITKPKGLGHSHYNTNTSTNNESFELPYLSVDDMEKFMVHKRMASDEYEIKKANNNVIFHDNFLMNNIGQKGQMINFNNDSVQNLGHGARSLLSERSSLLIPDLGISRGVNDVAKDEAPSVVAVETDDIFEHFLTSPSASFSLSNNRYGDLVPESRRNALPVPAALLQTFAPTSEKEENKKIMKSMLADVEEPPTIVKKPEPPKVELINGEQGRLFLRLLGLKDIRLPSSTSPSQQNLQICICIDNGVHCLTTEYYNIKDVNTFIPVGKEFELIVAEKLDLIITLKLKYEKFKNQLVEVVERKKVKSKSLLSRCLGMKDELITTKYVSKPAKVDELSNYVANDGSFAKVTIKFDQFKDRINSRSTYFNLDGINEYSMYKDILSGKMVKSKPNKVLSLDVNMMYIPRKSEYEIFPRSIKDAYEQLGEVNKTLDINHEGYLYQEGGDVEVWQRRFFKLEGTDLLAFNEHSKKLRAKINLKKVVEIIYPGKEEDEKVTDDFNLLGSKQVTENSLYQEEDSELRNSSSIYSSSQIGEIKRLQPPGILGTKSGGATNKKKSNSPSNRQFSETLILNEGFKIRFSNGETIDFGADTRESKLAWCNLLSSIISRNQFRRQPWVKSMISQNPNV